MDKERIVSEFTRIHPLIDSNNEYAKSNNGKYNYDISYVDLTESIEAIWGNFNKANKNAINSAIRKKINIKFSNSNKSLKNFFELYNLTMKRINVDAFYYFPLSFFEELSKNLENNFVIVTAEYEKKPIASTIFLYKYGFVHYWLSGSNYDFRNLYPNNLLIFESIKFFKKLGNHTFILMGGSNENLRRFKESFTKKRVEFYTISRVFNNEVFTYLNKKRKFQGNEFFPPYREVIKKRQ